jgi:hypothetical protein
MRVEDYSIEQRPLIDLPTHRNGDLISWLGDFGGDDQWVVGGENVTQPVVVLGDHIIVWQDEPLTDGDKKDAVSEHESSQRSSSTSPAWVAWHCNVPLPGLC